jgi:GNAT superfamily N-acetyltransferase
LPLVLRALDPRDDCRRIAFGDAVFAPLKSFLAKSAKQLHAENLAKTFVLVDDNFEPNRVKAYVTLLCTHVLVKQLPAPLDVDGGFRYEDYPAMKIARLAVTQELQGQGIGSKLIDFCIGMAVEYVMPHAGCRLLVLDAKAPSVPFYRRKGFTEMGPVEDDANGHTAMFIDMHRLNRAG